MRTNERAHTSSRDGGRTETSEHISPPARAEQKATLLPINRWANSRSIAGNWFQFYSGIITAYHGWFLTFELWCRDHHWRSIAKCPSATIETFGSVSNRAGQVHSGGRVNPFLPYYNFLDEYPGLRIEYENSKCKFINPGNCILWKLETYATMQGRHFFSFEGVVKVCQ